MCVCDLDIAFLYTIQIRTHTGEKIKIFHKSRIIKANAELND